MPIGLSFSGLGGWTISRTKTLNPNNLDEDDDVDFESIIEEDIDGQTYQPPFIHVVNLTSTKGSEILINCNSEKEALNLIIDLHNAITTVELQETERQMELALAKRGLSNKSGGDEENDDFDDGSLF